jgi:glycosyltransferase involved in cell wall biosynthesis
MKDLLKNKKILYLYDGGHPIFKIFMESIGAEIISNKEKISKDYDFYIFEGSYIRPVLLKKFGKLGRKKKIISWISDPRLYYLDTNKSFNFAREEIGSYPLFKKAFMLYFLRKLDGVFCMGNLIATLMNKYSKNTPVMKVPGFIYNRIFYDLENIRPELKNPSLLFIGQGQDYYCKGIDILIDSFKIVKEKVKDAKLFIVGNWRIKEEWKINGVYFLGYVGDLREVMKRCSLGIHLGRGEAFGVNIPEMMLAGLPVITSNLTGSKEVVEKFDSSFILELNKRLVAKKIINYFNLPLEKKKELSQNAKKVAKSYSEDKIVAQFKQNAKSFLEKL